MDKLELIINDHYYNYQFLELSEFYANLYSEKTDDKNKEKLLYLFAVLQSRLEIDLKELNKRIQTIDKHYKADDSKELLGIINTIDSLLFSLKTSKYEFSINEVYYAFLQEAKTYLKTSNGSQIPENIQPIQVVRYERIFMFTNEGNFISPEEEIDKILTLVSTRNASFDQMADEEKLQNLNIAIEFMLKEKKEIYFFRL